MKLEGLKANLNVDLYTKEKLSWQQMREVRLGLEENLNVSQYNNSEYY